jgi:hypothetical protein
LILNEPKNEPLQWDYFLSFGVMRMGLSPNDFWGLTFAEFWPLYNALTGKTFKPLSKLELESLEDAWLNVGNTRGTSSKAHGGDV